MLPPSQVDRSRSAWVMNHAGQGHIDLAAQLAAAIGLGPVQQGIDAAKAMLTDSAGTSGGGGGAGGVGGGGDTKRFVYMTLTNDHRPRTQREHQATLAWEQSLPVDGASGGAANGNARFIGPPAIYTPDSWHKKRFCNLSETLGAIAPSLRFGLPCAFGDADAYRRLQRQQEATPLNAAGAGMPPRWLVRVLRGKGVVAFGSGMRVEVLAHARLQAAAADGGGGSSRRPRDLSPEYMAASRTLLLRFLDPPMLHTGVHLGSPVATRWDTRIFGMVQWEPLRVWISSHGLIRGGSPWKNYTSALKLDSTSRLLWELSAALDPRCDPLPAEKPPWVDPARFATCAKPRADKEAKQPDGCCVCQTVADTLDLEHDQAGFATTGTLRKMDHIARSHNIEPRVLKRSMDETITRYLMMMQRSYQEASPGKPLSRWHTPMAIDVAFGADGQAYVYEGHLVPNWKRANHFWQPVMDREYALGAYAPLLLAASHMLVAPALDERHRALLGGPRVADADRPQLLEFLRDQGVASVLGFRRAWPSPRHAAAASYAAPRDVRFAELVSQLGLLLPGIDAEEPPTPPSADLLERGFWPFRGKLYTNDTTPTLKCEEARRVLSSWGSTAHGAV